MLSLREENILIIDNGTFHTKCSMGVSHEVIPGPSLIIRSKVGYRKAKEGEMAVEETIEEDITAQAETNGKNDIVDQEDDIGDKGDIKDNIEMVSNETNGKVKSKEDESIQQEEQQKQSNKPNQSDQPKPLLRFSQPPSQASHYLVGNALNEALHSDPDGIEFVDLYTNGLVTNWIALEALWRHILFKEFKIKRHKNDCPVVLTLPAYWTKYHHERVAQIFFERFNVPALFILDKPLAELYSVGQLTGIVIDIGWEKTDITPVFETAIQYSAIQQIPIGAKHMISHLYKVLMKEDKEVSLHTEELDEEFARVVMESGACEIKVESEKLPIEEEKPDEVVADVAKIVAEGKEKDFAMGGVDALNDKSDLTSRERVEIEYKDKMYIVGPARHRLAEPLFDGSLSGEDGSLSIIDGVNIAITAVDWDRRQFLWDNVVVTGDVTQIKGLTQGLYAGLAGLVVGSDNEYQAKNVRVLKIPDYFSSMKESPHLMSFLGLSIVAKLAFQDSSSRYFVSKVDYNDHGPSIIHTH